MRADQMPIKKPRKKINMKGRQGNDYIYISSHFSKLADSF